MVSRPVALGKGGLGGYKGRVGARFRLDRRHEVQDAPRQGDRDQALVAALGLVNRVIQLDLAANALLWHSRVGAGSSDLAAEGLRLCNAYRNLGAGLAALDLPGPTAAAIMAIVEHRLRLVRAALDLVYRPQTDPVARQRLRLVGVGPTAERLVELRDQLAAETSSEALDPLVG
jgi:hypothetical protein